jgi:hypothetical protein
MDTPASSIDGRIMGSRMPVVYRESLRTFSATGPRTEDGSSSSNHFSSHMILAEMEGGNGCLDSCPFDCAQGELCAGVTGVRWALCHRDGHETAEARSAGVSLCW